MRVKTPARQVLGPSTLPGEGWRTRPRRAGVPLPFAENRNWPEGQAGLASHFAEPQTSSFSGGVWGSLTLEHTGPIPAPWERERVLRTLRLELSTQTICVQPLLSGSDQALVSANEPGNDARRCALQFAGGAAVAAAAGRRRALALRVPGVAVVRLQGCVVRLGAYRFRVARVGLFGVEGGQTKSQRVGYAEAAHIFACRRAGADAALVDSRRATAGTIPIDDREISGRALASGVGRGAGRHSAPGHQRGIARLPAGSWEGTKPDQRGAAVAGLDDDHGELVSHLLSGSRVL